MQGKQDQIPVESDINHYMNQELPMFDSYTEKAFNPGLPISALQHIVTYPQVLVLL